VLARRVTCGTARVGAPARDDGDHRKCRDFAFALLIQCTKIRVGTDQALGVKTKFDATCKMVRSDWPRRWYRGGRPGLHRRGSEWGLPDCIAVVRWTASSRDAPNAPDCMQSPAMAVLTLAARVGRQDGGTSAGVAPRKDPPRHLFAGAHALWRCATGSRRAATLHRG
jgi:hypothetical protein